MESRSIELVISGKLLALSALTWFWLIPSFAGSGDQVLLPRFATGSIALFAAMMLAARLFLAPVAEIHDDPFIERGRGEPKALVALVVVWLGFVLLIEVVGFYLGGTAALVASFLILGVRRLPAMLAWALATPLALWAVFELGFSLRIPRGRVEAWLIGLAG